MQLKFIWHTALLLLSLSATAQAAPIYTSAAGMIDGSSRGGAYGGTHDVIGLFGAPNADLNGQSISMSLSFERGGLADHTSQGLASVSGSTPVTLTLTVGGITNEFFIENLDIQHRIEAGAADRLWYLPMDRLADQVSGYASNGYYIYFLQDIASTTPFEDHKADSRAHLSHTNRGAGIDESFFAVFIAAAPDSISLFTGQLEYVTFDGTAVDPNPPVPVPEPASAALMLLALLGMGAVRRTAQRR